MRIDLAALPDDVATLHRIIADLATALDGERVRAEIDRLRQIVKVLQRSRLGRRSERLDDDQRQLGLEDLDADIVWVSAAWPPGGDPAPSQSSDVHRTAAPAYPIICGAKR